MTKPHVFAMIGPPGAGKTTWCTTVFGSLSRISLDRYRAELSACGHEEDLSMTDGAVRLAYGTLRQYLERGQSVVWDATNANAEHRANLLSAARFIPVRMTAVVLLPSLAVVLDRNSRRDATVCERCGFARRVPADVVYRMHEEIAEAVPSLAGEGWDNVILA